MTVLHVDDDPNDSELLASAARKAGVEFSLQNVVDGEQAMAYLSGGGAFADRRKYPLPSLILLDLKMPRTTGFEVLTWLRARAQLGHIPVVVLSGSELRRDRDRAHAEGASSYLVKPLGFEALVALIRDLDSTWLNGNSPTPA